MYILDFTKNATKEIAFLKKTNPISYKKVVKLLVELQEHPRTGTGHPEPLTQGNDISYSRRINKKDRLIYDIIDDIVTVLVITTKGHYGDK